MLVNHPPVTEYEFCFAAMPILTKCSLTLQYPVSLLLSIIFFIESREVPPLRLIQITMQLKY